VEYRSGTAYEQFNSTDKLSVPVGPAFLEVTILIIPSSPHGSPQLNRRNRRNKRKEQKRRRRRRHNSGIESKIMGVKRT
jgi:hypothetical protein